MFHLFQLTIKRMKKSKTRETKARAPHQAKAFQSRKSLQNWIFCKAHGCLNRSANKRSLALAPVRREDVVLRPSITAIDHLEEQLQISLENMNLKR